MAESSVALAAIGLVGSILALVVSPLFKLLNANIETMKGLVESNQSIATETKKAAREAKERNGHLAELQLRSQELIINHEKDVKKLVDSSVKKVMSAVQHVDEQHVSHQVVDKQE